MPNKTLYEVQVRESVNAHDLTTIYTGTWAECKARAYSWMLANTPLDLKEEVTALVSAHGMYTPPAWESGVNHLHVQGESSAPGYVGYGDNHSTRNLLWVAISRFVSDEEKREAQEKVDAFDYAGMVNKCIDFVLVRLPETTKAIWRDVYDRTESREKADYVNAITPEQHKEFDALCDESDNGHSGASYGLVQVGTIAKVVGIR